MAVSVGSRGGVALGMLAYRAPRAGERFEGPGVPVGYVVLLAPEHARVSTRDASLVRPGDGVWFTTRPAPPATGSFAFNGSESVSVELERGAVLEAGTCGLRGARFEGDTILHVRGPDGRSESNDDECSGLGSRLTFEARTPGAHRIETSCFEGQCSGVVAWTVDRVAPASPLGSFVFTAASGGEGPTTALVRLASSQRFEAHTCDAGSAGEVSLALHDAQGNALPSRSSPCPGGRGARLEYDSSAGRDAVLRVRCAGEAPCRATVQTRAVEPHELPTRELSLVAAGYVAEGAASVGALGRFAAQTSVYGRLDLRVHSHALGYARTPQGGVLALHAGALAVWSLRPLHIALGLGAGASTMNARAHNNRVHAAPTIELWARFGDGRVYSFEAFSSLAIVEGGLAVSALGGQLLFAPRWRVSAGVRGAFGDAGFVDVAAVAHVKLGELSQFAPTLTPAPRWELVASLGAAALSYQPMCEFSGCIRRDRPLGPALGLGVAAHW